MSHRLLHGVTVKKDKRPEFHMRPGDPARGCEIHDWPTKGLARRLITEMRIQHGKGGVNACSDCLVRAKADAEATLAPHGLIETVVSLNAEQLRKNRP